MSLTSNFVPPSAVSRAAVHQAPVSANFEGVTDVHICAARLSDSYLAPGPRKIDAVELASVTALAHACQEKTSDAPHISEFMVKFNGVSWRVQTDKAAVDGVWFRCRRAPDRTIYFEDMGCKLPPAIVRVLLHPALNQGGIVLVTGAPGVGKTTTASAIVTTRLREHGGIAYTIEDPPEHLLNGWHGKGRCSQTHVAADGWAASLRRALRSQPAGMPSIMLVGELRDADAAAVALTSAASGFLVIATAFGTDIANGVETFTRHAASGSPERAASVAALLRVVVHQSMPMPRVIQARILVNPVASCLVAARIRDCAFQTLDDLANWQSNLVRADQDLWRECAA